MHPNANAGERRGSSLIPPIPISYGVVESGSKIGVWVFPFPRRDYVRIGADEQDKVADTG
jgi:hypothetical protein